MKRNILRALVLDAFYQVLDNWVFRILTGLTLIPILLTFLVGFREEGVVLFFGWKRWSYAEMPFGIGAVADPQGTLIEALLQIFIGQVAGGLGILLAISATAFFVPRLLEKGAAELYFHKPVSRTALYLSRYFAGLLFITIAASVLVVGTFLGFALVSRRADAGILLAGPTLVYVFALVFPFTMLVGVVTRSTVASILLSGLFFVFNGCIQQAWIGLEQFSDPANQALLAGRNAAGEEDEVEREAEEPRKRSAFEVTMRTTLDVAHALLPKTSDADTLARKMRRRLSAPAFRDADELAVVSRLPEGLAERDAAGLSAPAGLGESLGTARFAAASAPTPDAGLPLGFSLWSRPLESSVARIGERERVRQETASRAGEALEDALKGLGAASEVTRSSERIGESLSCSRVLWSTVTAQGTESRAAFLFKGARGKTLFTLLVESSATGPAFEEEARRITRHIGLDTQAIDEWYPAQLRLDAPWRTNILFSVGSSLAFAAALLALGLWRLGRIAF